MKLKYIVIIISFLGFNSCAELTEKKDSYFSSIVKILEHSEYPDFNTGFIETWVKLIVIENNHIEEYYIPYYGIDRIPEIGKEYSFDYNIVSIIYSNEGRSENIAKAKLVINFTLYR
jgi:hypothetical protein